VGVDGISRDNNDYQSEEMRALASWYRERAEAAENPTIWGSCLRIAEDLEEKAMQVDFRPP
jgi:hypothetical protein